MRYIDRATISIVDVAIYEAEWKVNLLARRICTICNGTYGSITLEHSRRVNAGPAVGE